MPDQARFHGVYAPVLTPFDADGAVDPIMLGRFCKWLLTNGVGLAVFGTNSEANSLTVDEKVALLDSLADQGIPGGSLMPGTGALALGDAVRLTRAAVDCAAAATLVLPPFYYKPASDEGLFAFYAQLIEKVARPSLKIFLYHIPRLTGTPITAGLVARLREAFPGVVVGIKDSSGDMNNTALMMNSFPELAIFVGSEDFLLEGLRLGGPGCISAMANVNPAAIVKLQQDWRSEAAPAAQEELSSLRRVFEGFPMISALKASVAHYGKAPQFAAPRAPLLPLNPDDRRRLVEMLDRRHFAMSDLANTLDRG